MTLFTATGLLHGAKSKKYDQVFLGYPYYIYEHYLDWFQTQSGNNSSKHYSWLNDVKELNYRRVPVMTCLLALLS